MALDEKKRKYRADGTAIDEKGDRSVVDDVALKDEGVVSNAPVSPTQVAEAPKQVEIKPVTPTPVQNPVTVQESQGGVNPEVAEKKVEQRSSNDGVAPPAELGPLVTTVTPINDNAPQLKGGTPVEAQNTDAQAQNISGTPEPQNDGTAQKNSQEVADAQKAPSTPVGFVGKDGKEYWYEPSGIEGADTVYTATIGGKTYTVWGNNKNQMYTKDGRIATAFTAAENLAVVKEAQAPKAANNGATSMPHANEANVTDKTATKPNEVVKDSPQNGKNTTNTNNAANTTVGSNGEAGTASALETATRKEWETLNDLALANVITSNRGKDSEKAKLAVKIASDILQSREKSLPPETVASAQQVDGANGNGAKKEVDKAQPEKGGLTDEEKKDKVAARAALSKYNGGNVNMSKRPVVSEERMREAGWVGAIGDTSLYPQMEKVKDSNGKEHKIIITPISADGYILSPDEVKEFVENLDGTDDFLANDTHGIIIKVDGNDDDLNEMDDLIKRAMKGELVTEMTEDEEEKYSRDNDPARKGMVDEVAKLQKQHDDFLAKVSDPNYSPKSVALEASESELKKYNEDTEKIGKRNRVSRIIANIGDVLQGFANLAGTWYGANSSKLTSLSGAVGEAQERVMTAREKRAEEMRKSIAKIKDQLKASDDADLKALVKRLDDANARLAKYDADVSKSNRSARQRKELEQYKTKQQNQRRAVEAKVKRDLAKLNSGLRKDEATHKGEVTKEVNAAKEAGRRGTIGYQEAEKRKTKGTPSYRDLHGGKSGKNGSKKRKSKGTVHG